MSSNISSEIRRAEIEKKNEKWYYFIILIAEVWKIKEKEEAEAAVSETEEEAPEDLLEEETEEEALRKSGNQWLSSEDSLRLDTLKHSKRFTPTLFPLRVNWLL